MAEDKKIEESTLKAVIADEIAQAKQFDMSYQDPDRANALEYRVGIMRDVKTLPNRSKMTSRDVADTSAWILPGIVSVFGASDKMVSYSANRSAGRQWALDASDFTNYDFLHNNDGYNILYDSTWDALHLGGAVAACYWKPLETKRETLRRQSIDQITTLLMGDDGQPNPDIQLLTQKQLDETEDVEVYDDATGQSLVIPQPLFDIKIERVVKRGRIIDKTCIPENLYLNSSATTIEDARWVGYLHADMTRSDLMEMADEYGFDKETIKALPQWATEETENEVTLARRYREPIDDNSMLASMDRINVWQCYIKADVDGDGIAELVQVWYAGNEILAWDVWEDDVPYTYIPCYPIPHQANAESVSDRTMDIQRAKTVLLRGLMDNSYAVALPQREVEIGSVLNPDSLTKPLFGGIMWKAKNTAPIVDHVTPFIGDKLLLGMQYLDEMNSKRTGVSRTTMALDPEALQNQTATANANNKEAAYTQIELIARNMAKYGGWRTYFKKRLKLAVKYQQVTEIPSPKDEDKFRQVNPQEWDEDMGVTINVGLGTGSRDRDMAMLQGVLQTQLGLADRLLAAGATNDAIEMLPKIIDTMIKIAESAGLNDPQSYYPDYTDEKVAELKALSDQAKQQPNPAIELEKVKGEVQAQTEQVKGQTQIQVKQIDAQLSSQQAELKAQGDVVKNKAELEADLATREADRQNALAIEGMRQAFEREKLERDDAFRYAQLAQQRELELMKMNDAAANNAANRAATSQTPTSN